jgi:rfaE bifunctional protein kinase chain/domain
VEPGISTDRLREIIDGLPGLRVAVVGDLILDEFIWGRVERISPEAPVPVVEVTRESQRLGGAANVAVNLAAVGAIPALFGAVGTDNAGDRFLRRLSSLAIDASSVVRDPKRRTTTKSRIIAQHQQVCRYDREDRDPPTEAVSAEILRRTLENPSRVSAVVVSDYAKGVVTRELVDAVVRAFRGRGVFVAVDPKSRDLSLYRGASLITPNKREAEEATGIEIRGEATLRLAAESIRVTTGAEGVLITRGEAGMSLLEGESLTHFPTMAREVFDVTGAGDTVVAVVAAAVAAGATVAEAAVLANHAAGVVVGKLGTASASIEELRASLDSRP